MNELEWETAEDIALKLKLKVSWREGGFYLVPSDSGYTPDEKAHSGPFYSVEKAMRSLLQGEIQIVPHSH